MIKRHIVETIYEYDNEGRLIKKTVTETDEENVNTSGDILKEINVPYNPYPFVPTCVTNPCTTNVIEKDKVTLSEIAKSSSPARDILSEITAMSTPASLDNCTADI